VLDDYTLTHLRQLEAESIHIIREVAAEFDNPMMLFSIGKDSMIMLHLAQKAFYPAPLPFPLLHVDTTFKFREMIAFGGARRDEKRSRAKERVFSFRNMETTGELFPIANATTRLLSRPAPELNRDRYKLAPEFVELPRPSPTPHCRTPCHA
jgi:3'-phosphoadenosine 5'-phosphosulfate sulfotransferase (PAPS reductase)/FAD synthetase